MADDFQFVKLPDGSYGKFKADATDDVIRTAILKDFPDAFKTQFEKDNEQKDTTGGQGAVVRTAKGVGRGLNNLVEGAYQTIAHPIDTASNIASQIEAVPGKIREANKEPSTIGKIAGYGAAVPVLGPLGKQLGERAAGGDVAGAVAEGLTTAGAPSAAKELVPLVSPALRRARGYIGESIHTPEGDLTPRAEIAAKVAGGAGGAAIGSTIGHEYIGGAAGYKMGPSVLDSVFPDSPKNIAARDLFNKTKETTESQEAALSDNVHFDKLKKQAQDAAYQKAGEENLAIQKRFDDAQSARMDAEKAAKQHLAETQQAHADALAAIEKARQTDLVAAERLRTQHGNDLMKRAKEQAALDRTAQAAATEENTAKSDLAKRANSTPAPASGGQDLISRTRKLVTPGEEPTAADLKRAGDLTQATTERLKVLAKFGDKLAQNELNRRLKN